MFPEDFLKSLKVPWAWLLGLLVVLCLVTGSCVRHQQARAVQAETRAAVAEASERRMAKEAQDATAQAAQDRQVSLRAEAEVARLQAALDAAPRPAPPTPAPATDPELAHGLQEAGLKVGLVVFQGDGGSRLAHPDAVKVWDWNQQALRIPALELRLTAAEGLAQGQTVETASLKIEVKDLDAARAKWQAAHGAALDQVAAEQDRVKALEHQVAAQHWKTAGEVVLAATVGYLLGRR